MILDFISRCEFGDMLLIKGGYHLILFHEATLLKLVFKVLWLSILRRIKDLQERVEGKKYLLNKKTIKKATKNKTKKQFPHKYELSRHFRS
jgi:hypothetical protein